MSGPTLVLPVVFPEPALYPLDDTHLEGLNRFDIVLSGYWEVPDQATPAEARDANETAAHAVLYEMAAAFSHAGASTTIRLDFGPPGVAEREYQARVVEDTDAAGIMLADSLSSLLNILIPLRDSRHQGEIVAFVSTLNPESIFAVELYHVTPDEQAVPAAAEMLEGVEQTLLDRGFSEADIERTVEVSADANAAITARARDHHLVVMGETEDPDADDQLFGPVCQYIAGEAGTPTIVVQA